MPPARGRIEAWIPGGAEMLFQVHPAGSGKVPLEVGLPGAHVEKDQAFLGLRQTGSVDQGADVHGNSWGSGL